MPKAPTPIGYGVTAAAALLLTLGGCEQEEGLSEPAANEAAPETTSIMRDDLDGVVRLPEPQLEPLEARISFPDGGAKLSELATAELVGILRSKQMGEGGPILLRAHSDSSGTGEANMRASRRRGEAVRNYLAENGVDQERMTIIAFGEQNPVQPNARPDGTPNEPGRGANRRVDLFIALPNSEAMVPRERSASGEETTSASNDAARMRGYCQWQWHLDEIQDRGRTR